MNLSGYWTGTFSGTNQGGISFSIDQKDAMIGGVATMHEPSLGVYQYVLSGHLSTPIRLVLHPVRHSSLLLGVIEANASLNEAGILVGRWQSSIGTSGVFETRRYEEPANQANINIKRTTVFISYSHQDDSYHKDLLVHLRPLEKAGVVDAWSDSRIKAGSLWKNEIEEALKKAQVAILLISPDFLASDFIVDAELPMLLEKARSAGTRILPVILRACRFTRDPKLSVFQAINDPSKPLAALENWQRDETYDRIVREIEATTSNSY